MNVSNPAVNLRTNRPSKVSSRQVASAGSTGWLDRKLRDRLRHRLEHLSHGAIEISDSDGAFNLGDVSASHETASLSVHNPAFYRRVALSGALGAAESFINGEWSSSDLVGLLRILARNAQALGQSLRGFSGLSRHFFRAAARLQRNTRTGSRKNIVAHYDLGNEFFELFLDPTMMYSSGCFDSPDSTLEEASVSKLDQICRRLRLEPTDQVIEIGTGWGGFTEHAVAHHECRVTTTTISPSQFEYAKQRIERSGLADSVNLLQQDYRDLTGQFDKLVSIEMIEAVGREYLDTYLQKCDELLKPGGRMVIQSIVMPEQRFDQYSRSVDFIQKYIFPGGFLPSVASILESAGRVTSLRLTGMEDYALSYARTLNEWRSRFFERLDDVRKFGFTEEFIRTWDFYFSYCEAAFLERAVGLVQMELVKV